MKHACCVNYTTSAMACLRRYMWHGLGSRHFVASLCIPWQRTRAQRGGTKPWMSNSTRRRLPANTWISDRTGRGVGWFGHVLSISHVPAFCVFPISSGSNITYLISYVNTSTSKRTGHDSQDQVFRRWRWWMMTRIWKKQKRSDIRDR